MTSAEFIKLLKQDGWYLDHVKGSHHQFRHPSKPGKVTVPHPEKDFPISTLASMFRQAQLPRKGRR